MKNILLGFILGLTVGVIVISDVSDIGIFKNSPKIDSPQVDNRLNVGDCVRKLGFNAIEKIILISPYGGIETEWKSEIGQGKIVSAYENKILLVKVNCK